MSKTRPELSPHVSALLDEFVPEHVRHEYPQLIRFIEAYFNYLEDEHRSGYFANTLSDQRDPALQDEAFLDSIQNELGLFVPRKFESDPRKFYNNIIDLWRSKGSREAIETFFRLLLDDEIVVRFPFDKVLKPSDGRFVIERKLRVSMISGNGFDFIGREIRQSENLGIAKVSKVERKVYSTDVIFELSLVVDEIVGEFVDRDEIFVLDTDLRAEIYRSVTGLRITDPGSGYEIGDRIRLKQFEGATFVAFVSNVDEDGGILNVSLSNFGAGNTPLHIVETNPRNERVYLEDYVLISHATDQPVASFTDEFVIDTDEGIGADFEIEYGAIAEAEGKYEGVKGQLSESIVLQDSKFYQKFSYEVISSYSINRWLSALKRSVHPSGTEVFSNVRVFNRLPLAASSQVFRQITVPQNYLFGENAPVTENLLIFEQNYAVPSGIYFLEDYTGTTLASEEFTNDTQPNLPDEALSLDPEITGEGGLGTSSYIDSGYVEDGYV